MLVVGDLDDVFLPSPTDLLVNLTEARAGIESLLGRLNDMFKDTSLVGNALGAGLQAAFKLVVSPRRYLRPLLRLTGALVCIVEHRRQDLLPLFQSPDARARCTEESRRSEALWHI